MSTKKVLFAFAAPSDFTRQVSEGFEGTYDFSIAPTKAQAVDLCPTAEVLVMISPISDVIERADACRWIHVIGAGVDGYLAIERIKNNSIPLLTNSSGIFGIQVSEHVFALLLGLSRGLKRAVLSQNDRLWVERGDHEASELELYGKKLVIVGLGDVGLQIAKRGKAFGLKITGVSRTGGELKNPEYGQYLDEVVSVRELDRVLGEADVVVDALPLTPETMNLFSGERFSAMKTGAIFLNVGRGLTVDERELAEAIKAGRLGFVGLDVFASEPLPKNSPLWKLDNVIISSHRAGGSQMLFDKAVPLLRDNLAKYSRGEPLTNLIEKSRGY
jgi:phosphoglycerate dehydrogenase-like enzyme